MTKIYKGEQTREKILQAAIELFGKSGFDQVSLQMIGEEVGISQAAVAQHFGNKRNIIFRVREVVTKSNQSFVDSKVSPYDPPTKQILDYCLANMEWGFKHRAMAQIIVLTYYFAMIDSEFREVQKRSVEIAGERIEKYVISCAREDQNIKKTETLQIAHSIHQFLFGNFVRELAIHQTRKESKGLIKNFEEVIPLLLKNQ